MKKILFLICLFVAVLGYPCQGRALDLKDDYPLWLKSAPPDSVVDPWTMYNRECTSFVAYRLNERNQFWLPGGFGNAGNWAERARALGYSVNQMPAAGSVAYFGAGASGASWLGHVAWVAAVEGGRVLIEEYNGWGGPHRYHSRWLAISEVTAFIHFKDLVAGTDTSLTVRQEWGSHVFTGQSGVKEIPNAQGRNLAVYQEGQRVFYDQVIEVGKERWVSYIAYSGNRRYVQIEG